MSHKDWMLNYQPENLLSALSMEIMVRNTIIRAYTQVINAIQENTYRGEVTISDATVKIMQASLELSELIEQLQEYIQSRKSSNS